MLLIYNKSYESSLALLKEFATLCKTSIEFQGHGWGYSYLHDNNWHLYKNINPIWEDDFSHFPSSKLYLIHARSAFRDEGIIVDNNMPFLSNDCAFAFNGELRGVKVKSNGKTGAEKIFNFILKVSKNNISLESFNHTLEIIRNKSEYTRAMNIILIQKNRVFISNFYNEDPEYYTLWISKFEDSIIISSIPITGQKAWNKFSEISSTMEILL